jgi:hypothetical protein
MTGRSPVRKIVELQDHGRVRIPTAEVPQRFGESDPGLTEY